MEDSEGAKYNIQLDGNVTKDKVLKIIELMDLINTGEEKETVNLNSVGGKIWNVLDIHFPVGKFTSSEIQEKYEDEYNEPVKLSIISTYLSRFALKGKINRTKTGREWTYQTIKLLQKQKI